MIIGEDDNGQMVLKILLSRSLEQISLLDVRPPMINMTHLVTVPYRWLSLKVGLQISLKRQSKAERIEKKKIADFLHLRVVLLF